MSAATATERALKRAASFNEALARRGVVYVARVPPYMRPQKMQHLLSQFGEVTRLYLAEEDQALARRRKKAGGNKNKCFTEGWVEFEDKKVAKQVAESLNGTRIGGKKRDFYAEDLWSIKYLRHFKWAHLTEKLAYERRVREQKLRAEVMAAKRENAEFVQLVEQGKQIQKMEERKMSRRDDAHADRVMPEAKRIRRSFHQKESVAEGGSSRLVDDALLSQIFPASSK